MDLKEYRSVANKTLVFGILKIYSKVYNCLANELLLVLKEIYSDYQKGYDRLADYEVLANYRMKCSKNKFANNHINGIKNFQVMLNIDYLNLKDKQNFASS